MATAVGKIPKVYVTKTLAEAKAFQAANPEALCFPTDSGQIVFNDSVYGGSDDLYVIPSSVDVSGMKTVASGSSSQATIVGFLGDTDALLRAAKAQKRILGRWGENTCVLLFSNVNENATGSEPKVAGSVYYTMGTRNAIGVKSFTCTTAILNSATGKYYLDELTVTAETQIKTTTVVNNLTSTSTASALSAAQGKALNDKITSLNNTVTNMGSVYRVKGTKAWTDIQALTSAAVGDVYNVSAAFTLNGVSYPAGTNVVCTTAFTAAVKANWQNYWDPLGGQYGNASTSVYGLVKVGPNISVSNGTISLTQANAATALGLGSAQSVADASNVARVGLIENGGTTSPGVVIGNTMVVSEGHLEAQSLLNARKIDGVAFDGTADITHYGTCDTAAATAAKVVSIAKFSLVTGARVTVKFTATNTAANPTLNVNGTGAKAIYYRGAAIGAGNLAANRVYEFVYDGTYYQFVGDINTNTTYNVATKTANGLMSAADKKNLDAVVDALTIK